MCSSKNSEIYYLLLSFKHHIYFIDIPTHGIDKGLGLYQQNP